jgi:arginyl-tRNA synthetase
MNIKTQIQTAVLNTLTGLPVVESLQLSLTDIGIEYPADKSHGDFSSNVAMVLFGRLKKEKGSEFIYKSPRDLAKSIVDILQAKNIDGVSNIEIAGPGFINFSLSDAFLLSKMGFTIQMGGDVVEKSFNGQKVMVEFTDPNPFKELHIGHLYSNIVGEAIAKSHEILGAEVKRACYQGDVGMHVSKSIWGMQSLFIKEFPGLDLQTALAELESQPINKKVAFLGRSYAAGATAYKDDEAAKENIKDINYLVFISAQENLKESTDFTPEVDYQQFVPGITTDSDEYKLVKQLYVAGRTWSLDYFNSMYSRIGMQFDEFFFESLVGEFGYQIVKEFLKSGVFKESNGAVIFPGSEYGLHDRVFINSLGLPTYEAKELGLAPEKYRRFEYDKSIVITGNEIDEYFKVLLKALEFTSPELRAKTTHLSHGMVRLPEGKMSSRTGKILTTEWLLDEAKSRIQKHMEETRPEFSTEQIEAVSETIGKGAVKFAFLKQSVGKDIAFSFDESLSFTGNSGPYMQYTYVRCISVLTKAENEVSNRLSAKNNMSDSAQKIATNEDEIPVLGGVGSVDLLSNINKQIDILLNSKSYLNFKLNVDEKNILRNLYLYSDVVMLSAKEFAPHHIATYLHELAQLFNGYYANTKIVTHESVLESGELSEAFKFKLMLVLSTSLVIKHGLDLLGIQTVDKM